MTKLSTSRTWEFLRLIESNTRVATARRAGKLVERLEGCAFDSCEGIQDLATPDGVEKLLDHLRTHPSRPKYSDEDGLFTTSSTISSVSQERKSWITKRDSTFC